MDTMLVVAKRKRICERCLQSIDSGVVYVYSPGRVVCRLCDEDPKRHVHVLNNMEPARIGNMQRLAREYNVDAGVGRNVRSA